MLDLLTAYTLYQNQNQNQENFDGMGMRTPLQPIYWIISILIGLFAAYLAFQCNKKEHIIFQLLATILAFIFSGWYLIYYVVRYPLLGGKCY